MVKSYSSHPLDFYPMTDSHFQSQTPSQYKCRRNVCYICRVRSICPVMRVVFRNSNANMLHIYPQMDLFYMLRAPETIQTVVAFGKNKPTVGSSVRGPIVSYNPNSIRRISGFGIYKWKLAQSKENILLKLSSLFPVNYPFTSKLVLNLQSLSLVIILPLVINISYIDQLGSYQTSLDGLE